ncbi:alpha/beta hydrolase family protein [Fluviicola chungangensis]|uniref:S9 family peptidase n=1 Tax=Fluviicola chungangensis TaxID=2597671 RepID=A0A556N303_9FLAO|nr:prolyl oligopeptidase family serine peptidase [Fluviicola chungangensis]TSJ46586.1 S9 family peptidase [Fluviicola chungangensis]
MKAAVGFSVLASVFLGLHAFGQKKILGPEVYDSWNRVGDVQLSQDGKFSVYSVKPYRGDGFLYLVNLETGKKDSVARGYEPKFDENGSFVVFKIHPGFDTLRKVELAKVNKEKWPKDSLAIWFTADASVRKYGQVKEFKLAEKGDALGFLAPKNEWPKGYLSKSEAKKEAKHEKKKGKIKTDGKLLTLIDPVSKEKKCFKNVTQFEMSKDGKYAVFIQQEKFKKDSVRLGIYDFTKKEVWNDHKRVNEYAGINFSGKDPMLLGMATIDTASDKRWSLFMIHPETKVFRPLIDTSAEFVNEEVLSSNFKPYLNNNDTDVFFGVADRPEKPFKDTLLETEKSKVDIWHWKDKRLQPQQLVELKRDQTRTNLAVYHLNSGEMAVLGNDSLHLHSSERHAQQVMLASCDELYRYETWNTMNPTNYYLVRVSDGKISTLREKVYTRGYLSPGGKQFVFWNHLTKQYYLMDTDSQVEECITCGWKGNFFEDKNGMIEEDEPRGIIGWGPDDSNLFVQAEKDILSYETASKRLHSLTDPLRISDQDTNYQYTLFNLNSDSLRFYPENTILTRFNKTSKMMEVYRIKGPFGNGSFELISGSGHEYFNFVKAKKAERIIFNRSSNSDFPDLFATTQPGAEISRISFANPQQCQYNWSTVELIKWNSYSGIPLEGLIYKPENFDANQEYPLLVYYYEMYSDEIHNHYAPKPTASIIYPTEYASAGYVVFIPNIRYTAGHPANSAYDCILSGTDAVLKKYSNIDPKRMGLQGQSWGGYQTAQLITMTDRFAAAMAGAPVGNMFSAYGGIRWGSGYSRQFQYEHSQSRIGKTIWDSPELYVENSPIFGLPKVKTPLLIMHNDEDGAVPWYQGIELYTGLRRLQKPVWLLNYNGDDHNLMKPANRMDLSIRMRQFFDYYLLNKPEPLWLKEGIPAIQKGKNYKYELTE